MSKAFAASLIIGLLILGAFGVNSLGGQIAVSPVTTTVWTKTTIPRSYTFLSYKPTLVISTTTTTKLRYIGIYELCWIAESKASGDGLSRHLFVWAGENLKGYELDRYVNHLGRIIREAHQDRSCSTEHARRIIDEAVLQLLETEG